jgi:hypothetical protein
LAGAPAFGDLDFGTLEAQHDGLPLQVACGRRSGFGEVLSGERTMYTVIRQYTGNSLRDIIKRDEASLRQTMTGVPGFREYHMVETKDGLATITVCEDKKGTQESTKRAAEWVKDHVPTSANLSKPMITEGETIMSVDARQPVR